VLWFAVWTTLVVATLVGAVLLGRWLWQRVKALMAQLKESSRVAEQLEAKVAELNELRGPDAPVVPTLIADDRQRAAWHQVLETNRERRRARRRERHSRTLARWRRIGIPL
jgi:hypothetical protein